MVFGSACQSRRNASRIATPGKIDGACFCCAHDVTLAVFMRFFLCFIFVYIQSLACGPAAREAGLAPGRVLSALAPARRSMVGSLRRLPVATMAGLMVALAEVRRAREGEGDRCRSRHMATVVFVTQTVVVSCFTSE